MLTPRRQQKVVQDTRRRRVVGAVCVVVVGAVCCVPVAASPFSSCVSSHRRLDGLVEDSWNDYRFGSSIAMLGDVDGDGVDDVAVGAPGDDHAVTNATTLEIDSIKNAGAVYIVLRNSDGSVKNATRWAAKDAERQDWLGASVACLGDLDGNGVNDLVVGVPGADRDFYFNSGGFTTLFLAQNGTVIKFAQATRSTRALRLIPLVDNYEFGSAIACLGDVNDDGIPDLAVGAHTCHVDGGCVYVCHMLRSGLPDECRTLAGETAPDFPQFLDGDYFGSAIAPLGDVDGDGVGELAVGAMNQGGTGAVYVLFLKRLHDDVLVTKKYSRISADTSVEFFKSGRRIGSALASAVDGYPTINTTSSSYTTATPVFEDGAVNATETAPPDDPARHRRLLAIGDEDGRGGFGAVAVFEIVCGGPTTGSSDDDSVSGVIIEEEPVNGSSYLRLVATTSDGVGGGPEFKNGDKFGSSVSIVASSVSVVSSSDAAAASFPDEVVLDDDDDSADSVFNSFALVVGAMFADDPIFSSGKVWQLQYGPFDNVTCAPQTLEAPPTPVPTSVPSLSLRPTSPKPSFYPTLSPPTFVPTDEPTFSLTPTTIAPTRAPFPAPHSLPPSSETPSDSTLSPVSAPTTPGGSSSGNNNGGSSSKKDGAARVNLVIVVVLIVATSILVATLCCLFFVCVVRRRWRRDDFENDKQAAAAVAEASSSGAPMGMATTHSGSGGHSGGVLDILSTRSGYSDVGYFDNRPPGGGVPMALPPSTQALVGFQLPEFDGETDDEVTPVGAVRNVLV